MGTSKNSFFGAIVWFMTDFFHYKNWQSNGDLTACFLEKDGHDALEQSVKFFRQASPTMHRGVVPDQIVVQVFGGHPLKLRRKSLSVLW